MNMHKQKTAKLLSGLAAVLMLAAMMITGCKQAAGNSSSEEKKYMVTVTAGGNGKVTAVPAIPEDKKVPKDQELTVTATADSGYEVDTWTVTPSSALQSGGTAGSGTAMVKIVVDTMVHVIFKPIDSYNAATGEGIVSSVNFMMKSIAAVRDGWVGHTKEDNNKPHTVSLTAYRIGETEVTQELWTAVMESNPSYFKGSSHLPEGTEVQGKRPVEEVSWFDCIVFCNELTKKVNAGSDSECVYKVDGHIYTKEDAEAKKDPTMDMNKKGFRLPTEAEWEWAAKGGKDNK